MEYKPLTREQYQKAIDAGFSPQQIIENEKKRKSSMTVSTPTAAKPGFWGKLGGFASDVFKGATAPVVKSLALGGEAIQDVAQVGAKTLETGSLRRGLTETKTPEWNLPYYGKITAPKTKEEALGTAAKTVSLGLGPVAGGTAFMGGQAMEENKGAATVAGQAILGGVLGKAGEIGAKVLGKGLTSVGGFLKEAGAGSKALRTAAEEQYAKVLSPTTKAMKRTAGQVVPGLAERKVTAFTQKGLLSEAEKNVASFGQQIEAAWEKLPTEHKTAVQPILENITKAQERLTMKGEAGTIIPEGNSKAFQQLTTLKNELISIAGETDAPTRVLREYRQVLDGMISAAGKGFGLGLDDTAVLAGRKTVANAIREQLAKATPDIAKINNEFTFWRRVQDVIGSTVERKTGQAMPLGQKMAKTAGMAAGFAHGGFLGALEGGLIMKNVEKLATSTAWNTFSASTKAKLADALASGDGKLINSVLENLAKGAGIVLEKTGKVIGGIPQASRELPKKNIPGTPEINLSQKVKGIPTGMSVKDISKVDGKSIPTILQKMDKEDGTLMTDFIDNVRLRKGSDIDLEIKARRMAEAMGLDPDVSNSKLANKFDQILSYNFPNQPR